MKPLLTVAIPTYNGGDNLIKAVKSCRYINLPNDKFEILVVDNCSTDGSIEKLEYLAKEYTNLRIVKNEKNYGRIGNWNRCLDLANGKYLIFLFSNDELYEGYNFKKYIDLLERDEKISIIFNKVKFRFKDNEFVSPDFSIENKIIPLHLFVERVFYEKKCFTCFGILQQHIYRMDTIKNNSIYFDDNLDRTTDRIFIFKNILNHKEQLIYFSDEVMSIWNFSHNRYHAKAHSKLDDDILTIFKRSWLQELEANAYILSKFKIDMKNIIKVHYENFYMVYSLNKIKKLLKIKYENNPDNITLESFIKLLEGFCKILEINYFKIKLQVHARIIKKILNKLIKKKRNHNV